MKKRESDTGKLDKIFPQGIIKVKMGYNPNSSSIGTLVYSYPYLYVVISAAVAFLAVVITGKKRK